ncbi:MAG: sulfatase family protein [Planctomycetota bacterium]
MNKNSTRRNWMIPAGTSLAISILILTIGSIQPALADQRSNILWICSDQQRYDTIHALGNQHIRTPNLDELVRTGTAFTHAYVQNPICTPSRSSFLTGRYPRTIRACSNGNDKWENAAPLITKTLADAGYDCGLAGKLHLTAAHKRIEPRFNDGYRVFSWSHHPHDDWPEGHAYIDWLRSKGIDYIPLKKKLGYIPVKYHQTTWCTDRAIDFIREERQGPWLFSINYFDPHPPLDPPAEYLKRFDIDSLPEPPFQPSDVIEHQKLSNVAFQRDCHQRKGHQAKLTLAKYWAMIELIDHDLGRLLKVLEDTNQRKNTLIIYTSDHGNMVGHHGLMDKGCRFYEGLVRVPFVMSLPGLIKENVRNQALVELVDIAPTLLELAGLPKDENMHGKSLIGQLTGRADPHKHRDFAYSTYTKSLPTKRSKYNQSYATMIRTRRHKLVVYHGQNTGQLFDLEKDPGEFVNLWDNTSHQKIKMDLLIRSFDMTVMTTNTGSKIVGGY